MLDNVTSLFGIDDGVIDSSESSLDPHCSLRPPVPLLLGVLTGRCGWSTGMSLLIGLFPGLPLGLVPAWLVLAAWRRLEVASWVSLSTWSALETCLVGGGTACCLSPDVIGGSRSTLGCYFFT